MYDIVYGLIVMLEVVLSVAVGFFIIKRDPDSKLNQLFLLVLFSFAIYLSTGEGIIYVLQIYNLAIISLFRDFSLIFSTATTVLLLLTALTVQYGDTIVESKRNLGIAGLVTLGLSFVGMPFDSPKIVQNYGLDYVLYDTQPLGSVFLTIIPGCFVGYSLFQYILLRSKSTDSELRQKLLRWTIGLSLMLMGLIYFILFSNFRYPGHLLFLSGLLGVFWAFK